MEIFWGDFSDWLFLFSLLLLDLKVFVWSVPVYPLSWSNKCENIWVIFHPIYGLMCQESTQPAGAERTPTPLCSCPLSVFRLVTFLLLLCLYSKFASQHVFLMTLALCPVCSWWIMALLEQNSYRRLQQNRVVSQIFSSDRRQHTLYNSLRQRREALLLTALSPVSAFIYKVMWKQQMGIVPVWLKVSPIALFWADICYVFCCEPHSVGGQKGRGC